MPDNAPPTASPGEPFGERMARIETDVKHLVTAQGDNSTVLLRLEEKIDGLRDVYLTRRDFADFQKKDYLVFKKATESQFRQSIARSFRLLWTLIGVMGAASVAAVVWGLDQLAHKP